MTDKPQAAASTFYSMIALLKVVNRYANYLSDSKEVGYNLKAEIRLLQSRIKCIDRRAADVLGEDAALWQSQWTDKDFEVFASVLFSLIDMDEQQRSVVEQFVTEYQARRVEVELK